MNTDQISEADLGPSLAELTKPYSGCRWPKTDSDLFEPHNFQISPPLRLDVSASVFTIGSCFARNIEEALHGVGFRVPMLDFSVPAVEAPGMRNNGIINRYTPQSIIQLLSWGLDCVRNPADFQDLCEQFWIPVDDGTGIDMDLRGYIPVTHDRFLERRSQLLTVLNSLTTSPYAVITLGQTESWFSTVLQKHWPVTPTTSLLHSHWTTSRYHNLDDSSAFNHIVEIGELARRYNPDIHVILTVSPVASQRYWSGEPAMRAYWSTKMTLWRAARLASRSLPGVHYFPSFEAVHLRPGAFQQDRIHVTDQTVRDVVEALLRANCDATAVVPRNPPTPARPSSTGQEGGRRPGGPQQVGVETVSEAELARFAAEGRIVGYRRDGLFSRLICYLNTRRLGHRLGIPAEFLWDGAERGANARHGYTTDLLAVLPGAVGLRTVTPDWGAEPDEVNFTRFTPTRLPDERIVDVLEELRQVARDWRLESGRSLGEHLDDKQFAWGVHARQGDARSLIWLIERYFPEAGWREIVQDLCRDSQAEGEVYLASDDDDLIRRFRLQFGTTLTSAQDFAPHEGGVANAFWDAVRLAQSRHVVAPAGSNMGVFVSLVRGAPNVAPEEFMGIAPLVHDLTSVALADYARDLGLALEAGPGARATRQALETKLRVARRRLM